MLELCPEGFEEVEHRDAVELAAYVQTEREQAVRAAFRITEARDVQPGWEEAWKTFHHSVRIGSLWIGPPWESPPAGDLAIVVDPGRAFGTGSHATTRLSLELLLDQPRTSLADLGCGSGVLAIAAAKLGFYPVVAFDQDEAAIEAARANASRNGVAIEVVTADVLTTPAPETELACANLERALVELIAARLAGRRLIASGYVAGECPELPGWTWQDRREADGWAADLFERT
jgi:ribosomal protein L11 methyltransferase